MNMLALVPVLTCGLLAQDPSSEIKVPRPPSVGCADKAPPARLPAAPPAPDEPIAPHRAPASAGEKTVMDAARRGLSCAFDDPAFVAFDQPKADGPLWAAGRNFKAAFDERGWQFIGQPAPGAQALQPIRFWLHGAQVGGKTLAVAPAAPVHTGRRVEFAHGDVVETIDVDGRGAEQTFTFAELPRRGELVLRVGIETALSCTQEQDGIRFRGPFDDVAYSPAVAIDAAGARIAAPATLDQGCITIRVPAAFVESAVLPLRIDPWVNAIQVYGTSGGDVADPDIAWDETGQVWAVVLSRYFGATDWDCYVQRVTDGNPMQLVGGPTIIDNSTDGWQLPRIANLAVYDVFLVVAQVRWGAGNPKHVVGRILGNSGVLVTNQFDIAGTAVDELRPDVGGNQSVPPPVYFTVVWEHAYSATDHDIYARQVDATGALRGTGPTYVQTNTLNQSWPSISKSCGPAPAGTQRFGIVYQQQAAAGDEDVHGALLTWDGVIVPVGGASTFPISTGGHNDILPQISSPTLDFAGRRHLLAVYERTTSNNGDILATCLDQDGALLASGNINALEFDPIGRLAWPQHRPCVDSDGVRFVVGYHELYNNNPTINDLDTRVSLVALGGNALQLEERGLPLAWSQDREFNVQVASRYSGSGQYSPRSCTTNDRDTLSNTFAADAYSYDGIPGGGFSTRATACGLLSIGFSGLPQVGGGINFQLSPAASGLEGYIVGLPASNPIGACPGCTIGAAGSTVIGSTWSFAIPWNEAFIGFVFAVQGFDVDATSGPCLGQIRLSDTVDVLVL